jgi:hypothetical protein
MRLASALMMLVLIALLMVRFRDPTMWRWAGRVDPPSSPQNSSEAPPASSSPVPSQPPANDENQENQVVGTDLDADEKDAAEEEFQAITDHTMQINKLDMPAYLRVLKWVERQSEPRLRQRAQSDVFFNDLIQSPEKYRGKLVSVDLNVRRIREYEGPSQHSGKLYEVWGFTRESKVWLYVAMVPELPPGMPVGLDVAENARLTGYFFKIQDYQDGLGRQGYAPLLMGRLRWQAPVDPTSSPNEWMWIVVGVCGVGVIGVFSFLVSMLRQRGRPQEVNWAGHPRAGALTMDEWLDRAESGELPGDGEAEDPVSESNKDA